MPFESKAQEAYMFANHPEIAARWEKETPQNTKLPEHVSDNNPVISPERKLDAMKKLIVKQ